MESVADLRTFISRVEASFPSDGDVVGICAGWRHIMEKGDLLRVKAALEQKLAQQDQQAAPPPRAPPSQYRTHSQQQRVQSQLNPLLAQTRDEAVELACTLRASLAETHRVFLSEHEPKLKKIKSTLDSLDAQGSAQMHDVDHAYMRAQTQSELDILRMLSDTQGPLEAWDRQTFERLHERLAQIDKLREDCIGCSTSPLRAYTAMEAMHRHKTNALGSQSRLAEVSMSAKGNQIVSDRINCLVNAMRPSPPTDLRPAMQRSGEGTSLTLQFSPPENANDIFRWKFADGSGVVNDEMGATVVHTPFTEGGVLDTADQVEPVISRHGRFRQVTRESLLVYQLKWTMHCAEDGRSSPRHNPGVERRDLKTTVPNKDGHFLFGKRNLLAATVYSFRVRCGYPLLDSWSEWSQKCTTRTRAYDLAELKLALEEAKEAIDGGKVCQVGPIARCSTCPCLLDMDPSKWAGEWDVTFLGEQGVDAGGLFFDLLVLATTELTDRQYGLFKSAENSEDIEPHPESAVYDKQHLEKFRLLGSLLAKALLNQVPLAISVSPTIVKRLLSIPLELSDLEAVDPEKQSSLAQVLNAEDVDNFCLSFEEIIESSTGGDRVAYNLETGLPVQHGETIKDVTNQNKRQFVDLKLKFCLCHKFGAQLDQIEAGLRCRELYTRLPVYFITVLLYVCAQVSWTCFRPRSRTE